MAQACTVPCPLHKKCGGCQLQHLPYPEQLRRKQAREIALLGSFGSVSPILGMENPAHYRNKVCAAFGLDQKKQIVSGVYQPGSHRIVPVDDCLIEDVIADRIIVDIRHMLRDFKIQVFDERSGRGFLRHVLVRRGFQSGEVMVVLVAASPVFPTQRPFVKKLLEKHPEITTVVLNVNDRFTPVVLGEREKVLYGSGTIEDTLCGHRFRISPSSFYQINPVQTEVLYLKAVELAAKTRAMAALPSNSRQPRAGPPL
jgi:23S rRNA (uracil1939-C5)-methyltransferase